MDGKNVAECVARATASEEELRYKVYGFFPRAFAGTLKVMQRTGIGRGRAVLTAEVRSRLRGRVGEGKWFAPSHVCPPIRPSTR